MGGRPPQQVEQLAPEPMFALPRSKPTPHLEGAVGIHAMLAPPAVLVTRGVTIACLAAGVCGAGLFGAVAFGAGFAAMGAGGAAVAHATAAQGAITMYGAMYPAATIAYFTSARAQPPEDDDVVVPMGGGLPAAEGLHHHPAERLEYKSQAEIEERESPGEVREMFREVE